jgi:hypothetical protein
MDELPSTASTDQSSRIRTYHCICTTLLLASTYPLDSLPRRAPPSLDQAYILRTSATPQSSELINPNQLDFSIEVASALRDIASGFSLLFSTTTDRAPIIIRGEDGFEKRTLVRCGHCSLVIGYQLDAGHYGGNAEAQEQRAREVVYLLSGGLVESEDLKAGRKPKTAEWDRI